MKSIERVNKFLEYLEDILEQKELSVPQFAQKMEVPKSTVYAWLNQSSVMSLEKYYRALGVLGIEEKLFLNEKNNVEKSV